MKKSIVAVLLLLFILSSASFAEAGKHFTDLGETHWAKQHIDYLSGLEIINGYPDGTFKPEANIKINEFITMTLKSMDYHLESMSTDWAKPYIDKAIELGVIENKEFPQYTADITREQMASIVVNALSLSETRPSNVMDQYVINDLKDYHLVSDHYKQNVIDSYKFGIITGYPDGTFNPSGLAKRSEASKVLVTMMKSEERKPYENMEAKSTIVLIGYMDENGENAIRYERMYAPIFNGKPVNEIVVVAEYLMSNLDNGEGYLNFGADPYTQKYSVGAYQSKSFYDGIYDAPTLMERSFLAAERMDFDFSVEPLNLTSKYKPYTMTIWKTQGHVDRTVGYDVYFLKRYEDQLKPLFDILFESESEVAWDYFVTGLAHEGERKRIETTINNRNFSFGYSGTGMTMTVSLKR